MNTLYYIVEPHWLSNKVVRLDKDGSEQVLSKFISLAEAQQTTRLLNKVSSTMRPERRKIPR